MKFAGHFHGWHEALEVGVRPPYEAEPEAGQLAEVVELVWCFRPTTSLPYAPLAKGDVAAVILEPTGGHFGAVPTPPRSSRPCAKRLPGRCAVDLRRSGDRLSRGAGGAQEKLGVLPDLTTWPRSWPEGCRAARSWVARTSWPIWRSSPTRAEQAHEDLPSRNVQRQPALGGGRRGHARRSGGGQAIRRANQQAAKLRHGMNEVLAREHVAWKIYGEHSDWKIFFGAEAPPGDGSDQSVERVDWRRLNARHAEQSRALRQALILHGVDFNGSRALVSTEHTDDIIHETLAAFEAALRMMKDEDLA